ncbi:TetR/AcrR family transcriptional regulator [Luminiphilus sp.]|nr:TetR/AcrR family transcriptional regulator [Luminiphilus sp.]
MVNIKRGKAVDGRRLRSERTRLAIIHAALALQKEGFLVPTAQQISDRAGVLIRTFFRHFEDMEALFKAADGQFREFYEALFLGGDREGTFEERLDRIVDRRADAFEEVWNFALGTQAQLWRYETLRENYSRNQRGLRQNLQDWLPELGTLPYDDRETVDAMTSFEMWHRLRSHQGLSKEASVRIVKGALKNLTRRN